MGNIITLFLIYGLIWPANLFSMNSNTVFVQYTTSNSAAGKNVDFNDKETVADFKNKLKNLYNIESEYIITFNGIAQNDSTDKLYIDDFIKYLNRINEEENSLVFTACPQIINSNSTSPVSSPDCSPSHSPTPTRKSISFLNYLLKIYKNQFSG